MAKKGDYTISDIYQGGYSSLKPNYTGPSHNGSYIKTGSFGLTTDPRSANILKEVSDKLSTGVKNIDVTAVSAEVFDSMPKQQLKEVDRLSKLTGVDISMHGPVMDVAGFNRQGRFDEAERENAEKKVLSTLLRAKELKPDGNIPVNFHTAEGIPGSQMLPPGEREKAGSDWKKLLVVNVDSGQISPLGEEEKFYPGKEEIRKEIHTPEKTLDMLNATEWDNTLSKIEFDRIRADEILRDADPVTRGLYVNWKAMQMNPDLISEKAKEELNNLNPQQLSEFKKIHAASTYANQAMKSAVSTFSKAYENANDQEKEFLKKASKRYGETLGIKDNGIRDASSLDPLKQSEALFGLMQEMEKINPKFWQPLEKFATEKTASTFGNAAYGAYKEFKGKNVPILNIENPPAGFGLSTGKDVKNVVVESRKKFVENAVKDGMNKKKAEKEAEKLIGATWDVGHINMLRKHGYTEEDIIKESEQVKDVLHMVHLSDNFGMEHTELPMGMGNVPFKEIMNKLGKKGFEAKKIIEAGNWWQHFRTPPVQATLEATGSPIYGMKMSPYWNQTNYFQEGYSGGFGQMLPQTNYQTFGAGFSQLPSELGGQRQGGEGSRMSGRPMQ